MSYEWQSHTAEVELHIAAPSETDVFREAIEAFGRYVELDAVGEPATHEIDLEARDRASLLVELFEELIWLADTDGFVPDSADVEVVGNHLRGTLEGRRTRVSPIVKAATYHDLSFTRADDMWQARIVLDV